MKISLNTEEQQKPENMYVSRTQSPKTKIRDAQSRVVIEQEMRRGYVINANSAEMEHGYKSKSAKSNNVNIN